MKQPAEDVESGCAKINLYTLIIHRLVILRYIMLQKTGFNSQSTRNEYHVWSSAKHHRFMKLNWQHPKQKIHSRTPVIFPSSAKHYYFLLLK